MAQAKDKVSKADTRRINRTRLQKAAQAAAAKSSDLDAAIDIAVDAAKRGERAALTFFFVLNERFAPEFELWWKLTPKDVTPEGGAHNHKALFIEIEKVRRETVEKSLARGLSNEHKLWSDMKKEAVREAGSEVREAKSTTVKVREYLSSAYRAMGKDDFLTDPQLDLQAQIFKLAIAFGAKPDNLNK